MDLILLDPRIEAIFELYFSSTICAILLPTTFLKFGHLLTQSPIPATIQNSLQHFASSLMLASAKKLADKSLVALTRRCPFTLRDKRRARSFLLKWSVRILCCTSRFFSP